MDKRDIYIKAKLQEDKRISDKANEKFKEIEGGIVMENNEPKERKTLKLSLNQAILAFTSLMIVVVLGGNLYAHVTGKPNIYSAIKGLFIKEAKYTQSEVEINQTVENNGIKLTLKTVAMDENVLITKYVAEGEKIKNEFYTYNDFEEDLMDLSKKYLATQKVAIEEDRYKNLKSSDVTQTYNQIKNKLVEIGLPEANAKKLLDTGYSAYKEYIKAQIEGTSLKKAKELISQTIAEFEANVSIKYQIMQSEDKLQGIDIEAISQKIEKSENGYIIYNVYNVDTITDLASKFDLIIKVNKIGNVEGKWNFETKLEKARLDTRVETIDFYENNINDNVAPNIINAERHTATVEAKRLVISDFSTVLMIQTRISAKSRNIYAEYGNNGIPTVYVVTDEEGNTLGTGTLSKDKYEDAFLASEEIKYTSRILLENVGKDTKKLYIKIYEQYILDETESYLYLNSKVIELDVEAARNGKEPIELTQSYVSKEQQVSFKFPSDWKVAEEENYVKILGKEDIDGEYSQILISKIDNKDNTDLKQLANPDSIANVVSEGEKQIIDSKGYYKEYIMSNAGTTIYGYILVLEKDTNYYEIQYSSHSQTQYERNKEIFEKILETIEYVAPEKSYRVFSSGAYETVKLYQDAVLTIEFAQERITYLKNTTTHEGVGKIKANTEYNIDANIKVRNSINSIIMLFSTYEINEIPMIYVHTGLDGLYCIDREHFYRTGEFRIIEILQLDGINVLNVEKAIGKYEEKAIEIFGEENIHHMVSTSDNRVYLINPGATIDVVEYVEEQQVNNKEETTQQPQISPLELQSLESIRKYFDIIGTVQGSPIEMLEYVLKLENLDIRQDIRLTGEYERCVSTGVSYTYFNSEILKCMTQELYFQQNWSKIYVEHEGMLYVLDGGATGCQYEIINVEKVEDKGNEYSFNVNVRWQAADVTETEQYYITVVESNGNMVVSYVGVG